MLKFLNRHISDYKAKYYGKKKTQSIHNYFYNFSVYDAQMLEMVIQSEFGENKNHWLKLSLIETQNYVQYPPDATILHLDFQNCPRGKPQRNPPQLPPQKIDCLLFLIDLFT